MKSAFLLFLLVNFLFFSLGFCRPVLFRNGDELLTPKKEKIHQTTKQNQEENDDPPNSEEEGYYFTDPSYYLQWHLQNLGAVPGEDLVDLALVPAWESGYSGQGVVVSVIDSYMDHSLPDLKDNIDESFCKDFNFGSTSRYPSHAEAVAGLIGAVARNNYCGAGVAFHSTLSLIRLLDASVSDATEAVALSWDSNEIDIYSCNWGPSDDGDTLQGPGPESTAAIEQTATTGRNGLGSIYVWAAGNGGDNNDNCNYDGYANSPFTIAVGSINSYGKYSSFSEPCSAMLTTAPGGEDKDDTIVGITTTDSHDCSSDFTGTDYSAPQVAGVVALMLEANPTLTWRDVQTIIVQSSRVMLNGEEKGVNGWVKNGAGLLHHDHYGFGLLNASQAVFLAKQWEKNAIRSRFCFNSSKMNFNEAISDNETIVVQHGIGDVTFSVEHVRVFFSASHPAWGDIAVNLTSPSGTISKLAVEHAQNNKGGSPSPQYQEWPFMTVKNWGENPSGQWTLSVGDAVADEYSGIFESWQLEVCGYYTTSPPPTPTPPPTYKPDTTPVVVIEYDDNRSGFEQFGAILWRFLVVMIIVGIAGIVAVYFLPVPSFCSKTDVERDEEGVFDPGDDL